jgi:hypothetical protein
MAHNWATHMEDGLRNLFRGFLDYCTVHMQLAECRIAVVMAFATFCLARLLFPISLSLSTAELVRCTYTSCLVQIKVCTNYAKMVPTIRNLWNAACVLGRKRVLIGLAMRSRVIVLATGNYTNHLRRILHDVVGLNDGLASVGLPVSKASQLILS